MDKLHDKIDPNREYTHEELLSLTEELENEILAQLCSKDLRFHKIRRATFLAKSAIQAAKILTAPDESAENIITEKNVKAFDDFMDEVVKEDLRLRSELPQPNFEQGGIFSKNKRVDIGLGERLL